MEGIISQRLRHRVKTLGTILGETMAADQGGAFLDKIEEIRHLAKSRHQKQTAAYITARPEGTGKHHEALKSLLATLDDDSLLAVARAFNQFLNLTNIAEQSEFTSQAEFTGQEDVNAASQLRGLFLRLQKLMVLGLEKEQIYDVISSMRCELVLTAHPTEITRRTLIQKYNRISDVLEKAADDQELDTASRTELERLVAEIWHTDEIRTERPSPQEEAKWGYAVIEHSFWHAVPALWCHLDALIFEFTNEHLPLDATPIALSSWMGGDRDGNPSVTAEVTREVLGLARWMAADLYLRDLDELLAQLSMAQCTAELAEVLVTAHGVASNSTPDEPYRTILRDLRDRLKLTRNWAEMEGPPPANAILQKSQLIEPLQLCYDSLCASGMGMIADGLLRHTLLRAHTFGVTLVTLDIRQSAEQHTALLDAITQYLGLGSYAAWSEKARSDFILDELESKRPLVPDNWHPEGHANETLQTFRLIAENNGAGISSYIISMAQHPSDVLSVVLLLRKCGLSRALPVVPLFETLDDLENANWTVERLLRTAWYKAHIEGRQEVMIGYSDSAKDVGQMAAAWAQYRAQEELVEVAKKYKITLSLFHGRGGAPGRGGGPARQAILSQPPGSVGQTMRVTEQGEMIRFKYGSSSLALINLDMLLSATIEACLLPPPKPKESWRLVMQQLADTARNSYRSQVESNPDFIDYFVEGTPERELALLALGSRPTRRSNMDEPGASRPVKEDVIKTLRAIPWVFAWTQKRLMLPAWLGTDTAFDEKLSEDDWELLQEMILEWPFFQTQISMLEMVLSKADIEISELYDLALVSPELKILGDEFRDRLTGLIASVNKIKAQTKLLEQFPEIKHALDLRTPYTDPLHLLQIELLRRCRNTRLEQREEINKALLVTIAGIAASMRNTG